MSKHTPGPWHTCKAFNSGQLHVMAGSDHGLQRAIAIDVWADNEESQANVRLIAAAPDMFEALDNINGLSRALRAGGPDPMDLQGLSDALEQAICLAFSAMAKATGA